MGERVFTKAQYGIESTSGTAVAATKIWPGTVTVPPDRTVQFLRPLTGRRGGPIVSSVPQVLIDGLTMAMPEAIYLEALPVQLAMLLDGTVSYVSSPTSSCSAVARIACSSANIFQPSSSSRDAQDDESHEHWPHPADPSCHPQHSPDS